MCSKMPRAVDTACLFTTSQHNKYTWIHISCKWVHEAKILSFSFSCQDTPRVVSWVITSTAQQHGCCSVVTSVNTWSHLARHKQLWVMHVWWLALRVLISFVDLLGVSLLGVCVWMQVFLIWALSLLFYCHSCLYSRYYVDKVCNCGGKGLC